MAARNGFQPPSWWSRADAYLRWAHFIDFRAFGADRKRFGILVELNSGLTKPQHDRLRKAGVFVARRYLQRRFVTAEFDAAPVARRNRQLDAIAAIAVRIELSTPVVAGSASSRAFGASVGQGPRKLLGVIDDGCPFAHAGLRAGKGSRVAFLWDQGATCSHVDSSASALGYGYNFLAPAFAEAIARATPESAPGNTAFADEEAAYEIAGQTRLRPLAGHGAHVLGMAADRVPALSRVSASRFEDSDATKPPSWLADPEDDADTALAFIQIPRDALDDSSGRWLGRNILDGIHALIAYAVRTTTVRRVTVNISYGPQTGPHDGSSLLERAIDDLVAAPAGLDNLFVVLPAGNSYQSRAHAQFELGEGGGPLAWQVPPDSETPGFLELWLPHGLSPADVEVSVRDPDGITLAADAHKVNEPTIGPAKGSWQIVAVDTAQPGGSPRWMVLVAIGPTGGYDAVPRPAHGLWTVTVRPAKSATAAKGTVHAYLARNDYNFGGLRKGKPSHFWQESYDPERYMRSREDDPPQSEPAPPVSIRSGGSISGLSTGVFYNVAAGYRISDRKPALYSSGGPSRGGRAGPDWAYPTDESRAFSGLNSWGNRSGASVRLTGTSTAAPQYARDINRLGSNAMPAPPDLQNADPRLGCGRKLERAGKRDGSQGRRRNRPRNSA